MYCLCAISSTVHFAGECGGRDISDTRNAFMHYAQEWINEHPEIDFTLTMTEVRGFKSLHDKYGDQVYSLLNEIARNIQSSIYDRCLVGVYNNDQLIYMHPTQLQHLSNDEKQRWYDEQVLRLSKELSVSVKAGICEHIDTSIELAVHVNHVHAALQEAKVTTTPSRCLLPSLRSI